VPHIVRRRLLTTRKKKEAGLVQARTNLLKTDKKHIGALGGAVHGPAEVCNLQFAISANEEVFGLDVAMNDVLQQ
jgi:hypothetical protein